MDSSHVLLALDEQKRWRERRKRIRERIRQLDRRRATLRRELEGIRRHVLEYDRVLADLRGGIRSLPSISPINPVR